MTGDQMPRTVRMHSESRVSQTLLVPVTGSAHYFQDQALDESDFDDNIVKPISPQLILLSVQRAFPFQ